MTEHLDAILPTEEEGRSAARALDEGNFDALRKYLERVRDWNLKVGSRTFSREQFIEERRSCGEPFDGQLMAATRCLSEERHGEYLARAAEAAALMGGLAAIQLDFETAVRDYTQAAELDPSKPRYAQKRDEYKVYVAHKKV